MRGATFRFTLLLALSVSIYAQEEESQPGQEKPATVFHNYVAHEFFLPYAMASPPGLDALEVRAELPGKHPLALLTHGTAAAPEERMQVTPWAYLRQATWFAQRGYVVIVIVRRGYGRSGGRQDSHEGGCGGRGSFTDASKAAADDLRAAVHYAEQLPEVDTATIISAGVSTGGLTQVALAAEPVPGLKATINFAGGRGGDGKGHNCNLDGLVRAFEGFGKHNKVPMLWIYAENDKWFPPDMSHRFDEAFRKGGGNEVFHMVPPDGQDGHHYFSHVASWSPLVEDFLRTQNLLPLGSQVLRPPAAPNIPPPPGLPERGLAAFHQFLISGPFKAFASSDSGFWGYSTGQFTQDIADRKAMAQCQQASKGVGVCEFKLRTPP